MKRRKSVYSEMYYRSIACIAQGALTNSKRPDCFVKGVYPTHFKKGNGSILTDVNNEDYVDYICSLGATLFGHNVDRITKAVTRQMEKGSIFSLGSDIEVQAAERLKGLVPFIDKVKFLKTGSDACSAAVKIARAYTGRAEILVEGYHGWHDMFVDARPGHGVDKKSIDNTYRGVDEYREELACGSFAAVIIEPIELDNSPERIKWLNELRDLCTKTRTILIFDEVITGFRYKDTTASKYHGVTPDLICLGKAMGGGGLPLAVVGGKTKVMECVEYFVSSTFGGDTLALAAFIEICDMQLESRWSVSDLWESGQRFMDRFNELLPKKISIIGYPTRGRFIGDDYVISLFFQESAKAGLLFGLSWFYNYTAVDYNDTTLSTCKDILENIKQGRVKLEGEPPVSPFAAKQRS
jgi:glutamate-1-semialdehyde 2,1-aminomutase